jgi:hypothetical protein
MASRLYLFLSSFLFVAITNFQFDWGNPAIVSTAFVLPLPLHMIEWGFVSGAGNAPGFVTGRKSAPAQSRECEMRTGKREKGRMEKKTSAHFCPGTIFMPVKNGCFDGFMAVLLAGQFAGR